MEKLRPDKTLFTLPAAVSSLNSPFSDLFVVSGEDQRDGEVGRPPVDEVQSTTTSYFARCPVRTPNSPFCIIYHFFVLLSQEKIKEMEKLGDHLWMDCNYLNEANEALHDCRYALQFTYVYAFYL